MYFDKENSIVKVEDNFFDIPTLVKEALEDVSDLTDEHLIAANKFLNVLGVKRIGYNGLKVGNYYEFIFKVEGDKFMDSHTERYEVLSTINSVQVRIGSVSDFALLVIGCKNPFMKSYYIENNMYHYISISFTCKSTKVAPIFQYARSLVNKTLSRGNSYISPDDVFKPEESSDELDDLLDFDQPSLSELILDLQKINGSDFKPQNMAKLFSLIADSYHHDENGRFISYFKILEYLSRNHQVSKGESKISKYLCDIDSDIKKEMIAKLEINAEYDVIVEYMRILRNMIVHPTVKLKNGSATFPIKIVLAFQKNLIEHFSKFEL